MQKATAYEPPGDVFTITDFYWEDREIQLRARNLKVFRAKAGTPQYEELEKIIMAISPDRIRAYNWVNPIGSHYELIINFPKQSQEPLEEIHDHAQPHNIAEDIPVANGAELTEETQLAEESQLTEETQLTDETQATEEIQPAEEIQVVEEAQATEEVQVADEVQIADDTPR